MCDGAAWGAGRKGSVVLRTLVTGGSWPCHSGQGGPLRLATEAAVEPA